ncbi:MAG: iron complex transport system ATP-binding protein [Puniceicoccaceae bacterium 5H]|nr:MAG: iron complex transport system ATP-binding protein [Puniceicoccaceae bacterium 5H]
MSSAPLIEVRGLTVRRSPYVILDAIDWRVERGQHWALLGPNGSGKTSLLQSLTGYLTPTSGRVEVCGQVYGHAHWPTLRERVGVVSVALAQQIQGDEEAVSVVASGRYAMLNFWGELTPELVAEAEALLEDLHVSYLARREWRLLSQGERQRVMMARGLMSRAELLFLDEPCSGLDPVARERFLRWLAQVLARPESPGVVLVTHHLEEIVPGIQHALLLGKGHVIAQGPIAGVVQADLLSQAYGAEMGIAQENGRYRLQVKSC